MSVRSRMTKTADVTTKVMGINVAMRVKNVLGQNVAKNVRKMILMMCAMSVIIEVVSA